MSAPAQNLERRTLEGIFGSEKIRFEDGGFVGVLQDGTAIKGRAEPGRMISGVRYVFDGRWTKYRGQKQFAFTGFAQGEPHAKYGLVKYLEHFAPNVGPAIAGRLYDAYGQDAVKILRTDPARVADEIKGLTPDRANEAVESLRKFEQLEHVRIELENLFSGRGFPRQLREDLIKRFGSNAARVVARDPFRLLVGKFVGCGFARCDRLYTDLGLPLRRLKRQMICLWHSIKSDNSRDTWLARNLLEVKLRQSVGSGDPTTPFRADRAIELGVRAKWLARKIVDGKEWIAERQAADDEAFIAKKIAELCEYEPLDGRKTHWPDPDSLKNVSDHQREKCRDALISPVAILNGGPGVGKTWTVAAIIESIAKNSPAVGVAVCAPTGKAAVRCTAEFEKRRLRIEAMTAHRLLAPQRIGHDGGGWQFAFNEKRHLPHRVLIIDEPSMLGTALLAAILRACARGTHILLTGDPNQLPPVDHGAPLRDLMKCVPTAELTEIKRNDGEIVRVCRDIREGRNYDPPAFVRTGHGINVFHVQEFTPAKQVNRLRDLLDRSPRTVDPIWDIQVLCTVNGKKTDISRSSLNSLLQPILNPAGDGCDKHPFRLGDKVICTSNCFLSLMNEEFPEQPQIDCEGQELREFVANGEIGKVIAVDEKTLTVRFSFPPRTVRAGVAKGEDEDGSARSTFDLAYAITVHKSQGSQARIIIAMIDSSNGANMVACRELYNTAFSRPEVLLITIGRAATVNFHCKRVALAKRKTFLVETLKELMPPRCSWCDKRHDGGPENCK